MILLYYHNYDNDSQHNYCDNKKNNLFYKYNIWLQIRLHQYKY